MFGGFSFWCKSQGLGCLMWGTVSSFLKEEFCICETPSDDDLPYKGCGFWQDHIAASPPVSLWPFYTLLWSRYLDDSQILFKWNCSIYSCRFVVSMERVNSGSSYAAILKCLSYLEHSDLCKAGTQRMKPNKSETEYHVCLIQSFKNCLSSMVCEVPANSSSLEKLLRARTQNQSLYVDSIYGTD